MALRLVPNEPRTIAKPSGAFGDEVKRLRTQAGMTQDEVAERLHVTRVTVSQIERGLIRRPSDSVLTGLERVLGLSRRNALALIAGDMTPDNDDVTTQFYRIAAIADRAARRRAWFELPLAFRQALVQFAQDTLLDAALRLEATDLSTELPSAEAEDEPPAGE